MGKDPEVICSSSEYKELKWIAGEFYWMESVETYDVGGWNYLVELRKFVEGGMTGSGFIDGVSGIVNRGCHNPPCGTGAVDGRWERAENFKKVLDVLFSGSIPQVESSQPGSPSQAESFPSGSSPHAASTPISSPLEQAADSGPSVGSGASERWYPDYNAQWSLGKCVNDAPIPGGRPTFNTGAECCNKSYGSQASGNCLSSLSKPMSPSTQSSGSPPGMPQAPPSLPVESSQSGFLFGASGSGTSPQVPPTPVSGPPSHQPTHQPTHWPTHQPTHQPTDQPTYQPTHWPTQRPVSSLLGLPSWDQSSDITQAIDQPVSSADPGPSAELSASEQWYPDYNPQWSLGKCVNEATIPSGRPTFNTGAECCQKAYAYQSSGACLDSLPRPDSSPTQMGGSPPGTHQSPGHIPSLQAASSQSGMLSTSGTSPQALHSPVSEPPTLALTHRPVDSPPSPVSPDSEAGKVIQSRTFINLEDALETARDKIDNEIFLYKTPASQWVPSTVYRYDDFKRSLYVMATDGVAGKKFYIGESDVPNGHVYGLVNIAAFLAQSMKETIQYDACDENSWDLVGGKYPLSNACGQLGQSYQDYHCPPHEAHMECPVDPQMSIMVVTHAKWYGAPGPLFCGPKTVEQPFSGFWDHLYQCDKGWANPPESCDVYGDQKAGRYDQSQSSANTGGRIDVEGCCWWGRGVIQTSGVCNFGKLNYYLGAGARADGRPAKYPEVDFCKDPEAICASSEYKELKWIAGEFYWMESVETYNEGGWNYIAELRKFVEGGMTGTRFIDGVSGIVNRGCHNPPCGTGAVDGGWERAENFKKVLSAFFGGSPPEVVGSSPAVLSPPAESVPSSSDPQGVSSTIGLPLGPSADSGLTAGSSIARDKWYPDLNPQWSLGKCVNEAPTPGGRPTFNTGAECCQKSYANQASGNCVDSLPRGSSAASDAMIFPESSLASAFAGSVYDHARQQSNFIGYSCGSGTIDIPADALVVDILFDYEIDVPRGADQAAPVLLELKEQIMEELSFTLGCQAIIRRNLERITRDEVLLGYYSTGVSDVIDGEKGSCTESQHRDNGCVPAIGHVAALFQGGASVDAMLLAKDVILHSIQDGMTGNSSDLARRVVYVGEHRRSETPPHPNDSDVVAEISDGSNSRSFIAIGFALMFVSLGVAALLFRNRKRRVDDDDAKNCENRGSTPPSSDIPRDDSDGEGSCDKRSSSEDDDSDSSSSSCSGIPDHDPDPDPALWDDNGGVNFVLVNEESYDDDEMMSDRSVASMESSSDSEFSFGDSTSLVVGGVSLV